MIGKCKTIPNKPTWRPKATPRPTENTKNKFRRTVGRYGGTCEQNRPHLHKEKDAKSSSKPNIAKPSGEVVKHPHWIHKVVFLHMLWGAQIKPPGCTKLLFCVSWGGVSPPPPRIHKTMVLRSQGGG
jgi:hypothetical protein